MRIFGIPTCPSRGLLREADDGARDPDFGKPGSIVKELSAKHFGEKTLGQSQIAAGKASVAETGKSRLVC